MRHFHYAGGRVVISDLVGKAVLRYARALALDATADIVSLPVTLTSGAKAHVHLLLGPASQILSTPILGTGDREDDEDREAAREFEERTRRLGPATPGWPDEMGEVPEFDLDL